MSGYNGVKGVGFDAGVITATTEYQITTTQESILYLPYAGTLDDLDELYITVNNKSITAECLYGDMPRYMAGVDCFSFTVQDAIRVCMENPEWLAINDMIVQRSVGFIPRG